MKASIRYQVDGCPVFQEFLSQLNWNPEDSRAIPCLPVEAFKHHRIQTGTWDPEKVFLSSGTTGTLRSQHLVISETGYQKHAINIFESRFGSLDDYLILALQHKGQIEPAFYLYNFAELSNAIEKYADSARRILLLGVTFALLDFADKFSPPLPSDAVVIETGGMKGRGQELLRSELHEFLAQRLGTKNVFSEYGMTEMMSQAYSDFHGRFRMPPSMQIMIREINDPLTEVAPGKSGIVHIIDLANIDTCSFIATGDLGVRHSDDTFEIIGRLDQSDIRGCHLLYL